MKHIYIGALDPGDTCRLVLTSQFGDRLEERSTDPDGRTTFCRLHSSD